MPYPLYPVSDPLFAAYSNRRPAAQTRFGQKPEGHKLLAKLAAWQEEQAQRNSSTTHHHLPSPRKKVGTDFLAPFREFYASYGR